jgi:hypothetical protein
LLDYTSNSQLLLKTFALSGFDLLLADQLSDPDGGRGLSSQMVEQPAILRRVILLAETVAQIEQTDQFALTDQWHDQLHAGCL